MQGGSYQMQVPNFYIQHSSRLTKRTNTTLWLVYYSMDMVINQPVYVYPQYMVMKEDPMTEFVQFLGLGRFDKIALTFRKIRTYIIKFVRYEKKIIAAVLNYEINFSKLKHKRENHQIFSDSTFVGVANLKHVVTLRVLFSLYFARALLKY